MPQTALGFLLQNLREERGLSFRELALLADIDHAYIYRLETGAKESPSDEVLSKLIRALKAAKREAEMLRYLARCGVGLGDAVEILEKEPFGGALRVRFAGQVHSIGRELADAMRVEVTV